MGDRSPRSTLPKPRQSCRVGLSDDPEQRLARMFAKKPVKLGTSIPETCPSLKLSFWQSLMFIGLAGAFASHIKRSQPVVPGNSLVCLAALAVPRMGQGQCAVKTLAG